MLIQILFLTNFITKSKSHVPMNTSEILMISGHADLTHDQGVFITTHKTTTDEVKTTAVMKSGDEQLGEKDDILFLPTERDITLVRNEDMDNIHEDIVKMSDVMDSKKTEKVTESPTKNEDVLFISGKNNEKADPDIAQSLKKDTETHLEYFKEEKQHKSGTKKPPVLDCKNLDCNLTKQSMCGGKKDRNDWKYRLFLNECFFRKVNCGFTYEYNRYTKVDISFCKNIGAHLYKTQINQNVYQYEPLFPHKKPSNPGQVKSKDGRRFSGRRSMTMTFMGSFCAHTCPETCTDDYNPECALSSNGLRQVFANHCRLDENSCQFGVSDGLTTCHHWHCLQLAALQISNVALQVALRFSPPRRNEDVMLLWKKRPLAECVGGKKADMQQNRVFINWMQRVGIVDRKGKLVLE